MLKVLATDNVSPQGLEPLRGVEGVMLDIKPTMPPDVLKQEIGGYQVAIIRSATKLKKDVLEHASGMKLIIRAGIGVDNIDVPYATERGIIVANTPQGNLVATAEHTFALITALARHVPQAAASLKGGAWEKKLFVGTGLQGKTLGIVGLGNVGQVVARIAEGFQMQVIAFDPLLDAAEVKRRRATKVELDDLLRRADIVTLHCPLNDQTRNLISAEALAKMKPSAFLINAARGGILDEEALAEALRAQKIRGAALDVFVSEPVPAGHPLLGLPNVVATPHIAASTREAQEGVAAEAAELIQEYVKKGTVRTQINRPR